MLGFTFGGDKIDFRGVELILKCLDVWVELILYSEFGAFVSTIDF